MQLLAYLLARFGEPSSYAGLGAVLALLGWHFSDTVVGQLAQFLAAGCGLLALVLRERGLIKAVVLVVGAGLALATLSACTAPPAMQAMGSGVAAAEISLTAAERLALVYTGLPRCPQGAPICAGAATVARIKNLDNQAYVAVKAAEGDETLLAAALAAIRQFQAAIPAAPAAAH